jgi:hypothetical protein
MLLDGYTEREYLEAKADYEAEQNSLRIAHEHEQAELRAAYMRGEL